MQVTCLLPIGGMQIKIQQQQHRPVTLNISALHHPLRHRGEHKMHLVHQQFVVAKVCGKYRGLAAVHRSYICRKSALASCLRVLNNFQSPANREALETELMLAEFLSEEQWNAEDSEAREYPDRIPFPFITTCLMSGSSRIVDNQSSPAIIMPFNSPFLGGLTDDKEAVTILDITNLDRICYCFVVFHEFWRPPGRYAPPL